MAADLEQALREQVEALGYELVELETAGSKARPILRVRVDLPAAGPDESVTVGDCARISRALEAHLDETTELSDRYVLEVSSPGVERPLLRRADFERFAGREVAVRLATARADGSKRIEGELLGLDVKDGAERIRVRRSDGSEIDIPRADVARAHLIFRWKDRR